MAPYHYFYELYKQKLHYRSAIKVGSGAKARGTKARQYIVPKAEELDATLTAEPTETEPALEGADRAIGAASEFDDQMRIAAI